jgi:hypothetical protein
MQALPLVAWVLKNTSNAVEVISRSREVSLTMPASMAYARTRWTWRKQTRGLSPPY